MNPDYILPEVLKLLSQWELVNDCYLGEKAVKEKGEIYLPNPSPISEKEEVRYQRYRDYIKRAVFYNVTRKTVKAMSGLVFAKYPRFDLPEALEAYVDDVSGNGQNLAQHARQALTMLLLKGRGGLLADFSMEEDGNTKASMKAKGLRPTIKLYEPEQIINWRTMTIGNEVKLSLVVLKESYIKSDDAFKAEFGEQLVVLRLIDGVATTQIYQKDGVWRAISEPKPILNAQGNSFDELPFTFIGADDNDETIDDAPIYDLAVLNLAHYRDSADYQESNFIAGQPTLFITGVTNEWYQDVIKPNGGIHLGSRGGVILGMGANAMLLQASANGANFEAMQHKQMQMVALGARLLETSEQIKTATQAGAEIAEQSSILSTIANNLSDAYSKAFTWCGQFMGVVGDCVITLNTNFATNKMTAQDRQQLIAEWQAGAISFGEMRAKLVEDEIATVEDSDEAKAMIESELQGYGIETADQH